MSKTTFTFPYGYEEFNKEQVYNFQLNRYYSMGITNHEEMISAGKRIHNSQDWKPVMEDLANKAVSDANLIKAAYFFRAAEFYLLKEDPEKAVLYDKFINCFNKATRDDGIQRFDAPYKDSYLPAIKVVPDRPEIKGTIVIHGGNDSFIEEFYPCMRYFAEHGYEVIGFDGPGQGAALKKYGHAMDIEWEEPVKAVLDYFDLEDVTLIGISMGGWLCLRAAAFESRISRVVPWSVSYDVTRYANSFGRLMAGFMMKHMRAFVESQMKRNMKRSPEYGWFMNNLMYITDKKTPLEAIDVLMQFNAENLHSELVKQDVLILTGKEDHLVPFKMHAMQVAALVNTRSVTERIFTREEQAQNHFQIGNLKLALDVILQWLNGLESF